MLFRKFTDSIVSLQLFSVTTMHYRCFSSFCINNLRILRLFSCALALAIFWQAWVGVLEPDGYAVFSTHFPFFMCIPKLNKLNICFTVVSTKLCVLVNGWTFVCCFDSNIFGQNTVNSLPLWFSLTLIWC